nr:MAG TPA: DNA repair protein-like protein [Caudoviricetes sp.]
MDRFRSLRADELDCRVGTCNDKGFSLLLYKDARCDQNVLDETVGKENWQRDHKEVKGNLFCGVSIWDENKKQWITKWDCGVESNTEKEKGEASDSFKRACFNWGIGRELYTAPFIYIKGNTEKNSKGNLVPTFKRMEVGEIEYEDGKITQLVILGDGQAIFTYDKRGSQTQNNERKAKTEQPEKNDELTLDKAYAMTTTKGKTYGELSDDQLQWIIDNARSAKSKRAAQIILDDRKTSEELLPIDAEEGLPF